MKIIEKIQALFESEGERAYGEKVSQLQHAIQVAKLAEQNKASDSLIAAGLLHDVGHLLYNERIKDWSLNDRHEIIGASLLKELFGAEVSEPVKLHVMAKRYLCSVNYHYYDGLSEASKESLRLQGGPLEDSHKHSVFEKNPFFEQALELRYWDDEGKDPENIDTDFARYIPLLKSLHSRT